MDSSHPVNRKRSGMEAEAERLIRFFVPRLADIRLMSGEQATAQNSAGAHFSWAL